MRPKSQIEPRFPFGFGLGYGRVEIGMPALHQSRVAAGDAVTFQVGVWNIGPVPSTTVVQIYLGREDQPPSRPLRALRAFQKVTLKSGEKRNLPFILLPMHFEHFCPDSGQWEISPGKYKIGAGAHSRSLHFAEVELVDE